MNSEHCMSNNTTITYLLTYFRKYVRKEEKRREESKERRINSCFIVNHYCFSVKIYGNRGNLGIFLIENGGFTEKFT